MVGIVASLAIVIAAPYLAPFVPLSIIHTGLSNLVYARRIRATAPTMQEAQAAA